MASPTGNAAVIIFVAPVPAIRIRLGFTRRTLAVLIIWGGKESRRADLGRLLGVPPIKVPVMCRRRQRVIKWITASGRGSDGGDSPLVAASCAVKVQAPTYRRFL